VLGLGNLLKNIIAMLIFRETSKPLKTFAFLKPFTGKGLRPVRSKLLGPKVKTFGTDRSKLLGKVKTFGEKAESADNALLTQDF
jgi:hypothetical protein